MRVGGLFPWSAFSLAKALSISLAAALAWLWFRRFTSQAHALLGAVLLILFASGARWLLLFLPEQTIIGLGSGLQLVGQASAGARDLSTNLTRPWNLSGGSPFPLPFAFSSGIFTPLTLALTGSGALPHCALLILLLINRRAWNLPAGILLSCLLASLALIAEDLFFFVWLGILLAVLIRSLCSTRQPSKGAGKYIKGKSFWTGALPLSLLLALASGGPLTWVLLQWSGLAAHQTVASVGGGAAALRLNLPPAFLSSQLGSLAIFDPRRLALAISEMGPAMLLAPLVLAVSLKRVRSDQPVFAGLGLGTIAAFAAPVILRLEGTDEDASRLTSLALFGWLVLGLPGLWQLLKKARPVWQVLGGIAYGISILGGLALFPSQLTAIAQPQMPDFIQEADALMCKFYWNQLEPEGKILAFGPPSRAVTIFGRLLGQAYSEPGHPMERYQALLQDPDPRQVAMEGYSYLYLDKETWKALTNRQREQFKLPCVRKAGETEGEDNDFRLLYFVRKCEPGSPAP